MFLPRLPITAQALPLPYDSSSPALSMLWRPLFMAARNWLTFALLTCFVRPSHNTTLRAGQVGTHTHAAMDCLASATAQKPSMWAFFSERPMPHCLTRLLLRSGWYYALASSSPCSMTHSNCAASASFAYVALACQRGSHRYTIFPLRHEIMLSASWSPFAESLVETSSLCVGLACNCCSCVCDRKEDAVLRVNHFVGQVQSIGLLAMRHNTIRLHQLLLAHRHGLPLEKCDGRMRSGLACHASHIRHCTSSLSWFLSPSTTRRPS